MIPTKSGEERRPGFDKEACRKRNVLERYVGWLKECRQILTRFEQLAVSYLAMLKLAMVGRYVGRLPDTT